MDKEQQLQQLEQNAVLELNHSVRFVENLDPQKHPPERRARFAVYMNQRVRLSLISYRLSCMQTGLDFQSATQKVLQTFDKSALGESFKKQNLPRPESQSQSIEDDITRLTADLEPLRENPEGNKVLIADTLTLIDKLKRFLSTQDSQSGREKRAGFPEHLPNDKLMEMLRQSPRNRNGEVSPLNKEQSPGINIAQELLVAPQLAEQAVDTFLASGPKYDKLGLESVVGFTSIGGVEYVVKEYAAKESTDPRYEQHHQMLMAKQQKMDSAGFFNYAPITLVKRGSEYYQVQRKVNPGADYEGMRKLLADKGLDLLDLKSNVFNWRDSAGNEVPVLIDFSFLRDLPAATSSEATPQPRAA